MVLLNQHLVFHYILWNICWRLWFYFIFSYFGSVNLVLYWVCLTPVKGHKNRKQNDSTVLCQKILCCANDGLLYRNAYKGSFWHPYRLYNFLCDGLEMIYVFSIKTWFPSIVTQCPFELLELLEICDLEILDK